MIKKNIERRSVGPAAKDVDLMRRSEKSQEDNHDDYKIGNTE